MNENTHFLNPPPSFCSRCCRGFCFLTASITPFLLIALSIPVFKVYVWPAALATSALGVVAALLSLLTISLDLFNILKKPSIVVPLLIISFLCSVIGFGFNIHVLVQIQSGIAFKQSLAPSPATIQDIDEDKSMFFVMLAQLFVNVFFVASNVYLFRFVLKKHSGRELFEMNKPQ